MTAFAPLPHRIAAGVWLRPLAARDAGLLAAGLAAIDPWRRLGVTADGLERYLAADTPGTLHFALRSADDALAGLVCVQPSWLAGSYLQILGVLPPYQGAGLGSAALTWFVREAEQRRARNAWVCVSEFNVSARRLYERHGFEAAAALGELIAPGHSEILMRRRLVTD